MRCNVFRLVVYVGCACLFCAHAPLAAAEVRGGAELRVTSDYVYRRYTRSDNEPSAQLDLHLSESHGLFAGAWLSRVRMDDARLEINPYAGAQYILTPDWRMEAALEGYIYDRHVFSRDADYAEAYATVHFRDLLSARLAAAVDAYGSGRDIVDAELLAQYPLTDVLNLNVTLGYEHARDAVRYNGLYGTLGLTYFLNRHVALSARYHGAARFDEKLSAPVDPSSELIFNQAEISISFAY